MTTSDDDSLDRLECPHCKKTGGLSWDYASRSVRCSYCYVSGIDLASIMEKKASEDGTKSPKNKRKRPNSEPQTISPSAVPATDEEFTVDIYLNDQGQRVVVAYALPKKPHPPEVYVSRQQCLFQQWRLKQQIINEKRYGRDDLRRRGFVEVERHRHEGRIVKIMAKPADE